MGDSKEANKYFEKSAKINKEPLEEKEIETYLDHQVCLRHTIIAYSRGLQAKHTSTAAM